MRSISRSKGLAPAIGAGIVLATALAGCTPSLPDEEGGDGSLTILLSDTVDSIDPHIATSVGGRQATWLVYESLVRVDPESGEAAPGIAESWDFTPTSASFVIREGVMCADGSEITAGTVARNFERMQDPETNAPLVNNFFGSADFTVEFDDDARTVDVALTTGMPFLGAEPSFTTLGIVCDSGLEDPEALATASDGTGPFVVSDYVTGSHVTLTRNDDYAWAPIDGFDVEELPSSLDLQIVADPDTQVNLLLGGDADAALLQATQLQRLEDETGFTQQYSDTGVSMLMFNERDGFATADEAVRIALAQALDRDELSSVETGGLGFAPDFLRAPENVCVDEDAIAAVMPSGGVEAARATLEEAGYAQNADGIYERDGEPVTVTLLQMETTSAGVELMRAAWEEVGIQVEVDDRSVAQAIDVLYSGTGWSAGLVGMTAAQPTGFRPFFVGPAAPEGPNFGAIANDEYAQLQGQASELGGLDSCSLWVEAEASIVEHADWMPTIATESQWVLADGVSLFNDGAQIDPLTIRG